ncbi:hypothetical protein EW145_g1905 [Phellinidium pouzarii]|uniref:Choline/carnitine acyltransferase domain-containing protein n=1 Tax=Phellinidium pouzarii TaxID=167371 RepID=A0A4S4LCV0_9AGAM|nr:hypothetical protein EW145_g1905 [Phellinidium pouzarii]
MIHGAQWDARPARLYGYGIGYICTDNSASIYAASHIAVLRRDQFYYFDVLDPAHCPLLTERQVHRTLAAIVEDADRMPKEEAAQGTVGVLSTENRRFFWVWVFLRFSTSVSHAEDLNNKLSEVRSTIKLQLKKVPCLGVAVGHIQMTED